MKPIDRVSTALLHGERATGSTPAGARRPALAINGRFLEQPVTGVQRVAREVTREIDRLIGEGRFSARVTLIHPPSADPQALGLTHIATRCVGKSGGPMWEQFVLPSAVGDDPLLCLGNSAPVRCLVEKKRVSVMLHDVSYIQFPDAYRTTYRWFHRLLLPLLLKRAERLFLVSETERTRLLKMRPEVASRIVVARNGGWVLHDPKPRARNPARALPKDYALYVGSLSRRKNVERLLRCAIALAREERIPFVFAGSHGSALQKPLLSIPEDVAGLIHFIGQVNDRQELSELYRGARLVVFPSLYEACPLPPLEAAHFDCPVVASNIPAIWERCDEGVTYCDPCSEQSILAAIRRVIGNKAERERRLDINRAHARAASWRGQAETILAAMLSSPVRDTGEGAASPAIALPRIRRTGA